MVITGFFLKGHNWLVVSSLCLHVWLGLGRNKDALVAAIAANVKAKSELGSKEKTKPIKIQESRQREGPNVFVRPIERHVASLCWNQATKSRRGACKKKEPSSVQLYAFITNPRLNPPMMPYSTMSPMRSIKGVVKATNNSSIPDAPLHATSLVWTNEWG